VSDDLLARIHAPDLRLHRSVLRDVVDASREPVGAAAGAPETFETDN